MTDEPENIVLQHLIAIRTRLDGIDERLGAIDARLVDLSDGQTELRQMILRLEADMVQVKRLLVNLQHRLRAQS